MDCFDAPAVRDDRNSFVHFALQRKDKRARTEGNDRKFSWSEVSNVSTDIQPFTPSEESDHEESSNASDGDEGGCFGTFDVFEPQQSPQFPAEEADQSCTLAAELDQSAEESGFSGNVSTAFSVEEADQPFTPPEESDHEESSNASDGDEGSGFGTFDIFEPQQLPQFPVEEADQSCTLAAELDQSAEESGFPGSFLGHPEQLPQSFLVPYWVPVQVVPALTISPLPTQTDHDHQSQDRHPDAPAEVETRVQTRLGNIEAVKGKAEYIMYLKKVPKNQRTKKSPMTPTRKDIDNLSVRAWGRLCRQWDIDLKQNFGVWGTDLKEKLLQRSQNPTLDSAVCKCFRAWKNEQETLKRLELVKSELLKLPFSGGSED